MAEENEIGTETNNPKSYIINGENNENENSNNGRRLGNTNFLSCQ